MESKKVYVVTSGGIVGDYFVDIAVYGVRTTEDAAKTLKEEVVQRIRTNNPKMANYTGDDIEIIPTELQ